MKKKLKLIAIIILLCSIALVVIFSVKGIKKNNDNKKEEDINIIDESPDLEKTSYIYDLFDCSTNVVSYNIEGKKTDKIYAYEGVYTKRIIQGINEEFKDEFDFDLTLNEVINDPISVWNKIEKFKNLDPNNVNRFNNLIESIKNNDNKKEDNNTINESPDLKKTSSIYELFDCSSNVVSYNVDGKKFEKIYAYEGVYTKRIIQGMNEEFKDEFDLNLTLNEVINDPISVFNKMDKLFNLDPNNVNRLTDLIRSIRG